MGFKIKVPKISAPKLDAKSPGNAFRNFNPVGGFMGLAESAYKQLVGGGGDQSLPGEDPTVTALRNKMMTEASDYRRDMGGMMQKEEALLKNEANSTLDTGLKNVRRGFNDRGLLYSGTRAGAEGDLRNRVATQLAGNITQSRGGFEQTARDKEQTAAAVGLAGYQDALDRSERNYRTNLESSIARRQAMQSLGGALGQGVGNYYGSRRTSQRPNNTSPVE